MQDYVDCIVRFHDPSRIFELSRCIFSLVSQDYQPVNILLVVQRFSQSELASVRQHIEPLLAGSPGCSLRLLNYSLGHGDSRSAMINFALSQCHGRYLGFLDYDDVLYPEAYKILIETLQSSHAAVAFASVRLLEVEVCKNWLYALRKRPSPFRGSSLIDLFRQNFCPLHSYLLDKTRIEDPKDLSFDPLMTLEEDYDFLLKVCAKYESDFSLLGNDLGDYYFKTDGSNTPILRISRG